MITIAAVPKPFAGVQEVIQRNAVRSWSALPCQKKILLLGGEKGAAEMAREVGGVSIDPVERDQYGVPLLSSAFARVGEAAVGDTILYVNADIILLPQIATALETVQRSFDRFLLVARRWNFDCSSELTFEPGWDQALLQSLRADGELVGPQFIDLFAFSRGLYSEVPDFAIGRAYWDNWLVHEARRTGTPVIDGTGAFTIVHQNHPYSGFSSLAEITRSQQGKRNLHLAGDSHMLLATIADSTHTIDESGLTPSPTRTVSVVIPHQGPLTRLRACLRALTHQSYPHSFIEIVVAANDPGVGTEGLRLEFPFIEVCRELSPGPAAARNKGAACSTGEILAFLNGNCVPGEDWISEGVEALGRAAGRRVVAGNLVRKAARSRKRRIFQAFDAMTCLPPQGSAEGGQACTAANLFTSRELFREVGGFDEGFAAGWDWARRATRLGASLRFAPGSIAYGPELKTWRDLTGKVKRSAGARAVSWRRLRESGARLEEMEALGPPTFRELRRRVRVLLRQNRPTAFEKAGAIGVQLLVWPLTARAWRKAARDRGDDSSG